LRLRVKDVDFGYGRIIVRDGKGMKDRVTMLPQRLRRPLREHLDHVKAMHERDRTLGFGAVICRTRSSKSIPTPRSHGHGNMFSPLKSDRSIR
jgi:integrase